jgi:hypothetical protein
VTGAQRKGWLAGVGGVAGIASILGLLTFWEDARPLADWLIFNLRVILARPQVEAVLLSIGAGVALTLGLPWLAAWNEFTPERTRTRLRLYAGTMAFAVAWYLQPTRVGFVYAVLSGLSGTQLGMTAMRWLQNLVPERAVPQSLKDGGQHAP